MTPSRMRQEFGFCMIGAKSFAPYERPKKNTKLARDAPIANPTFNSPENCCDIEPIRIIVSRYTCGFAKVKMKRAVSVGKSPFAVVVSISIAEFDLKTLISRIMPYHESQIDETPKRIFEN